jgi:hypothetical protein
MADKVQCETHGERFETFVCEHLTGDTAVGQGFNRNEPTVDEPFPDACCDNCELIRVAHGGWNEQSEKLTKISLLCSECYERSRIRNTRTGVTFDDLADLRWKCHSCDEWHTGPCLDFCHDEPIYWGDEEEEKAKRLQLLPNWGKGRPATFLNEDYCAVNDEYFYVRGNIHLPILGTKETLRWGVWGSLSPENFKKLMEMEDDPKRVELPPMFSWLSNNIPEYPDTINLKMYAHIQEPGWRPHFELEPTDHPLAQEYHKGISPERVKEIMLGRLRS